MSNQERILLVRLSHLGDVVHALPVFHALRSAHPGASLAWAVQPEFAPLVRGLGGLERVIEFDRRGGARAWLDLRDELGAFAPTLTVDAQGNLKSAFVTLASGAARRVGLDRSDWREALGARVLSECAAPLGARSRGPHALERMLHLARHLAPGLEAPRRDPDLGADEREQGERLLQQHVADAPAPILVQLSQPADVRAWPPGHFAELARALAAEGRTVLVLSGPAEEQEGARLARELAHLPAVRHWVGQRGLRELASVMAAASERGGRFVGVDSGPMHLAVSVELDVVALCGPQDEARTGPWPLTQGAGGQRVVRAAQQPDCAPCLARRCNHPEGPVCMTRIRPGEVLDALHSAP